MELLQRELVRHIMGNFGIAPPPHFGAGGITTPEFKTNKAVKMEYTDGEESEVISYPVWAGQAQLGKGVLRVAFIDIEDEFHEYCVVFRVDDLQIYGVKHIYMEGELASFYVWQDDWVPMTLAKKLYISSGIEQFADHGPLWTPGEPKDLFKPLASLVDMS